MKDPTAGPNGRRFVTGAGQSLVYPSAASTWNAKLDRAHEHLVALRSELADFKRRSYSLSFEINDRSGDCTILLHIKEEIPARFATIVGDVIHNLRSALDAFAYELARLHVGRDLTNSEARACKFPIYAERKDLDGFFNTKTSRILFGRSERLALEIVAPGWEWDILPESSRGPLKSRADSARNDTIWILNNLWNIDKHRRLSFVVWWPEIVYWSNYFGDAEYIWNPGTPPFKDGSIFGTIHVANPAWLPAPDQITASIEPRLAEDGVGYDGVAESLTGLYEQLRTRVFPRALSTWEADQRSSAP